MTKQNEKAYFSRLSLEGQQHAQGKPFTDEACGDLLMSIGQAMSLLPRPPARLLDIGCGTAWTSEYFARAGYSVAALDISLDMVQAAARQRVVPGLRFLVGDFESIPVLNGAFDAIVSYGSLHHTDDVLSALRSCKRVLKTDGVLILMEPGKGHEESETSRVAVEEYGVTERSLPPKALCSDLRSLGYRQIQVIPWLALFSSPLSLPQAQRNWKYRLVARLAGSRIADSIQLFRSTTENAAIVLARA